MGTAIRMQKVRGTEQRPQRANNWRGFNNLEELWDLREKVVSRIARLLKPLQSLLKNQIVQRFGL